MTPYQIDYVLKELGCSKIEILIDKVIATCPFAKYKHRGGTDNKPSFYVNCNDGRTPGYSCLSCQVNGTLLNLVFNLAKFSKKVNHNLYNYIKYCNPTTASALSENIRILKKKTEGKSFNFINSTAEITAPLVLEEEKKINYLPESFISEKYVALPQLAKNYLAGPLRKLTAKTMALWELYYDKLGYICIPVRDHTGQLVGITKRAIDQSVKPKYMHTKKLPKNNILFGENKCVPSDTCYLVEGHFDAIWLWQCGYRNVFCLMGSSLSKANAKNIIKNYNNCIIIRDGNEAGLLAGEQCKSLLNNHIRVMMTPYIEGLDPNSTSPEILKQWLGEPISKKVLTTWFESDINMHTFSWRNSLESATSSLTNKDNIMTKTNCNRCQHEFLSEDGKKSQVLQLSYGDKKLIEHDFNKLCDSCIKDIERLYKQILGKF